MTAIRLFIRNYLSGINFAPTDLLEIILLAVAAYYVMLWIRDTRAWALLRGVLVMGAFILAAAILQLNTILYLVSRGINVLVIAAVVIFQPELRRALEQLGQKKLLAAILPFELMRDRQRISDQTVDELIKGSFEMGKARTGALIVIEKNQKLNDYIRTGIELDSLVSSQLLLNIFEHNTPLHDGAIIIRENRIIAATCYLPLSDNMELSKEFGTRHRAGVGISELTDSVTIIVSEETGEVSTASMGKISRGVTEEQLRETLLMLQEKNTNGRGFWLRRRTKNEKTAHK